MANKLSKKGLSIIIASVALIGAVGATAALTKGFTNFGAIKDVLNVKDSSKEASKINLRSFDFTNDQSGSLNENTLVNFVNSHNKEKKEVFSQVSVVTIVSEDEEESETGPCIEKVYLDGELGIRLGNENNIGYFSLDCIQGYKFDHLKIEAVNYHKYDNITEEYEKESDGSTLRINGTDIDLAASASLSEPDSKITKTLIFNELQNTFEVVGLKGRPCILKLELWSE